MYAPTVREITQLEREIEREQQERVDEWRNDAIAATYAAMEDGTLDLSAYVPA